MFRASSLTFHGLCGWDLYLKMLQASLSLSLTEEEAKPRKFSCAQHIESQKLQSSAVGAQKAVSKI